MSYNNSTYIGIRKQVAQHLHKFFSQIPKKGKKRKIHVRWVGHLSSHLNINNLLFGDSNLPDCEN
jgi:hypothetical protein